MEAKSAANAELSPIQEEIVDFMVRLFRMLGLPKSLGSIYGFVYASPNPVTLEDLTQGLKISAGSASQGLRTLKVFRAVRPVYSSGDRRERFEAETDFQRFLGGFLAGELEQYIENTEKRTARLENLLVRSTGTDSAFFEKRVRQLGGMKERARRVIPLLREIFSSEND